PSGQFYIAPDHLGSPHQIADASANSVWLWDHDPFGNGAPSGAFGYNLRFPGQFFDQRAKLHYNYFRDYDPNTGRYIESDPIGLRSGINTYAYVGGNPVTFADPFGLWTGGIGFGGSGQLGPININGSVSIVVDGNGNVGISTQLGSGLGIGEGLSGGITFSGSNAKNICDLAGPFFNGNVTTGTGLVSSVDIYMGPSNDGLVTGGGVTIGAGFGGGGGVGGSYTWITPIGQW
ncbi:MAG: RHS repeat-associated core domain-containing protein, partial [Methylocella sp.]